MKPFNAIKRFGAKVPAAVGTGLLVMSSGVFAALPEGVETKVTASQSNIDEMGVLMIGVTLALAVWVWLRRSVRA